MTRSALRRTTVAAGTAAACLAAAGAASATATRALAPTVDFGKRSSGALSVTDRAGTLTTVWRNVSIIDNPVFVCRTPAGGTACTPIEIGNDASSGPRVLRRPRDGALFVLIPRLTGTTFALWLSESADGGATWSAPAEVAAGVDEVQDAALTPDGGAIDVVGNRFGSTNARFQRIALGAPAIETRSAQLGDTHIDGAVLTHMRNGRPLVAGAFRTDVVGLRAPARGADPDVQSSWRGPWPDGIRGIDTYTLARGRSGPYLLTRDAAPSPDTFRVRLWHAGPRGAVPAAVVRGRDRTARQTLGGAGPDSQVALDISPNRRLTAVWSQYNRRCPSGHGYCLIARRSDRHHRYGRPRAYSLPHGRFGRPTRITATTAPSGRGWLQWTAVDDAYAAPL